MCATKHVLQYENALAKWIRSNVAIPTSRYVEYAQEVHETTQRKHGII